MVLRVLENQSDDGIDVSNRHVDLVMEMKGVVELVVDNHLCWGSLLRHVPEVHWLNSVGSGNLLHLLLLLRLKSRFCFFLFRWLLFLLFEQLVNFLLL